MLEESSVVLYTYCMYEVGELVACKLQADQSQVDLVVAFVPADILNVMCFRFRRAR